MVILQTSAGLQAAPVDLLQAPTNFGSGLAVCASPFQPVVLENPTLVSDCTQNGLQAALNQGGQIGFACGSGDVTIALTAPLER